jgi:acyl-CoA thioester hydrolase
MRLPEFEIEISVPFHDVDVMEIVWHGHYVKYFEIARCALLQSIGYDYPQMKASGFAWPVIDLHIRYPRPARYGQTLKVRAMIREYDTRLRIAYVIRDAATGERLTKGSSVQVAIDMRTREMQYTAVPALVARLKI